MPWIRLSDNYMDDEKIDALSDGAFRLWHAGMAYCRRNHTDGLIPFGIMRGLKSYTKGREKQLATPFREGLSSLWKLVPGMGYIIANYLKYNLSKEEDQSERTAATARMRKFRANQEFGDAVTSHVGDVPVTPSHPQPCDAFVPGTDRKSTFRSERESERKQPDDLGKRAGRLLYRYRELFEKHRNGAKTRLIGNSLEFEEAVSLCALWDDARLEKLAQIVLTTDEPFIAKTDRGFKIFSIKASWADDRLRQIESGAA